MEVQLTLFQPGANYAHQITVCYPEFENLSTLLNQETSINDNFSEPSDFRSADATGHKVIKH